MVKAPNVGRAANRAAAAGRGLPPGAVIAPSAEEHLSIGHAGAARLMAAGRRVDAVVCTSDLIAFGARRAFAERGGRLPRFIGFDDSPMNDWVAPWLSSVRIPYDGFGAAIVSLLGERIDGKRSLLRIQPHRLVLRDAAA